jgi:hypothetical protein
MIWVSLGTLGALRRAMGKGRSSRFASEAGWSVVIAYVVTRSTLLQIPLRPTKAAIVAGNNITLGTPMRFLLGAGVLIDAAAMTKYFGVSLVPLAFAYALARRRWGTWAMYLLIPVRIVTGYQL